MLIGELWFLLDRVEVELIFECQTAESPISLFGVSLSLMPLSNSSLELVSPSLGFSS